MYNPKIGIGNKYFNNSRDNLTINNKNSAILSLKLFLLLAIFFVSLSLISAAEINFIRAENSSGFSQGEALIAKLSGNFIDKPTSNNVFFYRGHVRIPMVYEISEMNDDFYIYAMTVGKTSGNYSLSIENVRHMQGTQEVEEKIVKNFTINQNLSDFSIEPGFVINDTGFSIEVQNLQNNQVTINIDTSDNLLVQDSVNVNSGELKSISFQLKDQKNPFSEQIKLTSEKTSYAIPIFITSNLTSGEEINNSGTTNGETGNGETDNGTPSLEESFKFEPGIVRVSMATGSKSKRIIYIMNTGETEIKDMVFFVPLTLSPYVTITSSKNIKVNSSEKVEITIESDTEEKLVEGEISAESENFTSDFKLILNFTKDYTPPEDEQGEEVVIVTTCVQLKGTVCTENYKCSGETADTKDGVCCIQPATCQEVKKSSTGKIIGWLLVVFVVLLLFWFFKRYKKVKPQIKFPK